MREIVYFFKYCPLVDKSTSGKHGPLGLEQDGAYRPYYVLYWNGQNLFVHQL